MSIQLTELSINGLFTVRNETAVLDFLEQNPQMVPALRESYHKIKEYFPESQLTLDLMTDPEWPFKSYLIIWVGTDLPAEKELSILFKMNEEWICNLPDDIVTNLIINLGL